MKRRLLISAAAIAICLSATTAAHAVVEIKIATVAPRGSMWMKIFNKMKARILKETNGDVKIRFYPGQVQGDERDVVRKMRTGQLNGGAFTAIGLGLLNPQVLIMQMPGIFKSYASVDRARKALTPDFEAAFRKRGYELLGWGEVGWIHLFTKNKITTLDDLKKQKVWVWNDDPISKAMLRKVGVSPRLLSLPQVLPSLNTGMINAVYNSPLGCMALQWHSKVKYMGSQPVAIGIGATVITKAVFDKISPENQKKVKEIATKYHNYMIKRIRKDNEKALKALKDSGIEVLPITKADMAALYKVGRSVANSFVPRYYPKALLDKLRKAR